MIVWAEKILQGHVVYFNLKRSSAKLYQELYFGRNASFEEIKPAHIHTCCFFLCQCIAVCFTGDQKMDRDDFD